MNSKGQIVHFLGWDKKFVPQFIDFVQESYGTDQHLFLIYGAVRDGELPEGMGSIYHYYPSLLKAAAGLLKQLRQARKVILHGLFSAHLYYLLALQPWVLRKCYWVIWGGDLYVHNVQNKDWRWYKNEWIRRFVIPRLGHVITHFKGDYELAKHWYGARGELHKCFMYTSNIFADCSVVAESYDGTNILLGNSASQTNNHIDALEKLRPFAGENIKIHCPLSYGDPGYADRVAQVGKAMFGGKFIALREFMPFERYIEFLAGIDIAIFNHDRQQGVGNTITLLGQGVKVYMKKSITTRSTMDELGIKVFDLSEINLDPISDYVKKNNKDAVKREFSEENLRIQLRAIFE